MKQISKEKRQKVFFKYNCKCAYCGCDISIEKFHVDHIEPLFRGATQNDLNRWGYNRIKGTNSIDNLNPSCASCNYSKSTFSVETWRKELELKKQRIKRDSSTYNLLLRFGCILEIDEPIVFYFERH